MFYYLGCDGHLYGPANELQLKQILRVENNDSTTDQNRQIAEIDRITVPSMSPLLGSIHSEIRISRDFN